MIQGNVWNGLSQCGGVALLILAGICITNADVGVEGGFYAFVSLNRLLHDHSPGLQTAAPLPVSVACLLLATAGDLVSP